MNSAVFREVFLAGGLVSTSRRNVSLNRNIPYGCGRIWIDDA